MKADEGRQGTPARPVELVADVWFIIMGLISPSDIVHLSHTCKTLFAYAQFRRVWYNALARHRFLPKNYPHLRHAPTNVIRRQLFVTATLDAAFSQGALKPVRGYSLHLEFPGLFQGMKFLPGGDWLVVLSHSWMLDPVRHSNICLFKLPTMEWSTADTIPAAATLQSEWYWSDLAPRDGPYKSSRGDDLILLRAFVNNQRTFAICHLDTKTPSVKITFVVHTPLRTRNDIAAGDYFIYGWITDERRHIVRIMKLNGDYTKLDTDVIAEIDCPAGNDGKLMVRYGLRLPGKGPLLLLITTRLMAAYDISNDVLTPEYQPSLLRLQAVWKYVPENVSFGRILRVLHEGAIVTLYEGKVRFIYPEIDSRASNAKAMAICQFLNPRPYSVKYPVVFTPRRIFWNLRLTGSLSTSEDSMHLIEAAMVPAPSDEESKIDRIFVSHEELILADGGRTCSAQDWDELSGKLCLGYIRSGHLPGFSWQKAGCRITILEMV